MTTEISVMYGSEGAKSVDDLHDDGQWNLRCLQRGRILLITVNTPAVMTTSEVVNPLTAGAVHIRFLHFLLAHYISAFKHIED